MQISTVIDSLVRIPETKLSEMVMMLSTEANKNKTILLVEGPDDRTFYSRFVSDCDIVFNVLEGCYFMPKILSLAKSFETLQNKLIGIKDADFDHIIGTVYATDTLFLTDTHDWETMVMTEECENNLLLEALGKKDSGLFNKVMTDLVNYSYFKLYNFVELCSKNLEGINFKGLSLSKFYDGTNPCRIDLILSVVKAHANNAKLGHFPSEGDLEQFKRRFPSLDLSQLTCGHDVIHGVVRRLTFLKGVNISLGKVSIEMLLRCSYSIDIFKTTRLYQAVSSWAMAHGVIVWLT